MVVFPEGFLDFSAFFFAECFPRCVGGGEGAGVLALLVEVVVVVVVSSPVDCTACFLKRFKHLNYLFDTMHDAKKTF